MSEDAASVAYHNKIAKGWDERYRSGAFRRRADFFEKRFLPELKPGKWLDAGCGTGFYSRMLAKDDRQVVGVDAASNMLKEARDRSEVSGQVQCITYQQVGSIEALGFESDRFDGVICLSVVEYLAEPECFFAEVSRVVKGGGQLVLSLPHRHSAVRYIQKRVRGTYRPAGGSSLDYLDTSRVAASPKQLSDWLTEYGFQAERIEGFDPILPSVMHPVLAPSLLYVLATKNNS